MEKLHRPGSEPSPEPKNELLGRYSSEEGVIGCERNKEGKCADPTCDEPNDPACWIEVNDPGTSNVVFRAELCSGHFAMLKSGAADRIAIIPDREMLA